MTTLRSNGQVGTSRRNFLKQAALFAAAPAFLPSLARGGSGPNSRVTMAILGCGNQAAEDLKAWLPLPNLQIVAVCDVNRASYGYKTPQQFLGREPIRNLINAHYAQGTESGAWKGVDMYTDFREILARKDIDTVAVITPDHWHTIMTVRAAEAGKDIYCQKPLTLTMAEGPKMIAAVRKHGRILQTGSQWRSNPLMRKFCEMVRNGAVGKIQKIETLVAENNFFGPGPGWKPDPVPEGFDYDAWLGPAPKAPYHRDRCLYKFRFVSDYSGGQTTNFGAHSNDIARWAMGDDGGGPVEVEDLGAEFPPPGDLYDTATKVNFRVRFANGVELVCLTRKPGFGVRVYGELGWIEVDVKGIRSEPAGLASMTIPAGGVRLYESNDHYKDFVDCVVAHKEPIEPVEEGIRTVTLCHLGNIAMKLHRKIKWDPKAERFIGDDEANAMLSRSSRAPWG